MRVADYPVELTSYTGIHCCARESEIEIETAGRQTERERETSFIWNLLTGEIQSSFV